MSNGLTRQQLGQYFKDDRTIRAFENIQKMSTETLPDDVKTILSLIEDLNNVLFNSIDFSDPQIKNRLNELEEKIQTLQDSIQNFVNVLSGCIKAVKQDQEIHPLTVSMDEIRRRLEAIEGFIGI